MNKKEQEYKLYLEQQLQWCKERDRILEKIEMKLHEMKKIASYVVEHEPTEVEKSRLNSQLEELRQEVHVLEKQLHSVPL